MPKNPDAAIVDALNDVLTAELTAINQYFLHAQMCSNWGYKRLYGFLRKESIEEMKHAEEVMDRLLYLGGIPNVQRLFPIRIGESVPEMFKCDMALEIEAVDRLNIHVPLLRDKNDVGSALILEKILAAEEEHIDWIEAQQDMIQAMGLENYLATQVGQV